ncbi:MAG: Ig-like domain-containing protein [Nitrospirae bacterium]|nr:Ig-like domain-containing protein [Nitrospirota bacterium]
MTATDTTDTTDTITVTQTAAVTFTAGAVSATTSTVSASPTTVTADGVAASTITITLKDAGGNPVSGKTVTLSSSRGGTDTLTQPAAATDANGQTTGTIKSTTAGTSTVTATDTTDTTDTITVTQTAAVTFAAVNLVGNPSFETDTSGWDAYSGSTIQRVAGGYDGAYALGVTGPSTTASFGVNDKPNWVALTGAAGTHYRATAWVRSAANTGQARLKIREYIGGTKVGTTTYSNTVVLSPSWQLLTLDYVTTTAGSTLDFQVLDDVPVVAGEVFQTDNIAIYIVP